MNTDIHICIHIIQILIFLRFIFIFGIHLILNTDICYYFQKKIFSKKILFIYFIFIYS